MSYSSNSTTNLIIGRIYPKRKKFTAADIVREHQDTAKLEDLVKEKNPGISFDLLSGEAKLKAQDKLAAFDKIIPPGSNTTPNQKQEHDSFKSEEQEFRFWYDQVLPNLAGIPSSDPP